MLDFEKLQEESRSIERDQYIHIYPSLISYFSDKDTLTLDDFVRGAHMVYAWMPTILTLHFDEAENSSDQIVSLINLAKKQGRLDEAQLGSIAKVTNNSVVGASKLLHFISPAYFPIWDSRVYSYLNGNAAHGYRVNNAKRYLEYVGLLRQAIAQDAFKSIHDAVNHKIGYKVTAMRAIELIMFQQSTKTTALKRGR